MKKLFLTMIVALVSFNVSADSLSCGGKKTFSSPYPGAGGSVRLLLRVSEEDNTVTLDKRTYRNERESFDLVELKHERSKSRYAFKAVNQHNESAKGFIYYLTSSGVRATYKFPGQRWNSFHCAKFIVND